MVQDKTAAASHTKSGHMTALQGKQHARQPRDVRCVRLRHREATASAHKPAAESQRMQVQVLLCNTKVGSLGLNLTWATEVIILDVWWNGVAEDQAADRCHRIGQDRPVNVRPILGFRV